MKKLLLIPLLLGFMYGCSTSTDKQSMVNDKPVPIVDFSGIEPLLNKSNDTTYLVNFWATWCAPCVKEIPYFERINVEYSKKKLKVILINLDFPNHYETRLLPYLKDNKIQSKVIVLDDPDANRWINLVDPSWSGSIPATIIFNKSKRLFFEKEFKYEELKDIVDSFLL